MLFGGIFVVWVFFILFCFVVFFFFVQQHNIKKVTTGLKGGSTSSESDNPSLPVSEEADANLPLCAPYAGRTAGSPSLAKSVPFWDWVLYMVIYSSAFKE